MFWPNICKYGYTKFYKVEESYRPFAQNSCMVYNLPCWMENCAWDFVHKATILTQAKNVFVLDFPGHRVLSSMADLVPCDRIVQRTIKLLFLCRDHVEKTTG